MQNVKNDTEKVLEEGWRILNSRPELADMTVDEILDELDDGTQQMNHNRWGVIAWIVVNSLESFEPDKLIQTLSTVDIGFLTCQYIGYILQTRHHVIMEELILRADQSGKFDPIVFYVSECWLHENTLREQYISNILEMLERHSDHERYHSFLRNYADYISRLEAQELAIKMAGEISNQTKYYFAQALCQSWYRKDVAGANNAAGDFLTSNNIWSQKAGICFIESGLDMDAVTFRRYFPRIVTLLSENDEQKQNIIPLLVKYIIKYSEEDQVESDPIYSYIWSCLKMIPKESPQVKHAFFMAIQRYKELPKIIQTIFDDVISSPFEGNENLLNMVAFSLYHKIENGDWESTLQSMLKMFVSNKYARKYNAFFERMEMIHSKLKNYESEVVLAAFAWILRGNVQEMVFGVGLLIWIKEDKNLSDILHPEEFSLSFSTEQMLRIIKAILYTTLDGEDTCRMAFQLLTFSEKSEKTFIDFCETELFEQYPETMHDTAEDYKLSDYRSQSKMAHRIIETYDEWKGQQKMGNGVRDLQPSLERTMIFRRAQMEMSSQIAKTAREKSYFINLFGAQTMKYGKNIAHVAMGREGEKLYQVSPYMVHEYHKEISYSYLKNPVLFQLNRNAFLMEVENNAVSNKGISAPVERKK